MKLRRIIEWTEKEKEKMNKYIDNLNVILLIKDPSIIYNKILEIEEQYQNNRFDWRK